MQELEKVLEEIEKNKHIVEIFGRGVFFVPLEAVKQIIRKHMDDGKRHRACSRNCITLRR